MRHFTDRPLATAGLISYRCKGTYGWIMIGAANHVDAMREARRSSATAMHHDLQVWNGSRYVLVELDTEIPVGAICSAPIYVTTSILDNRGRCSSLAAQVVRTK